MAEPNWRVLHARIDAEAFQSERRTRLATIQAARAYFNGEHPKTLKVEVGRRDHNVIINLCRSLVNKSVAWLFGDVKDGELLRMQLANTAPPGAESAAPEQPPTDHPIPAGNTTEAYLEAVWKKNGGVRLLQRIGRSGAIAGHVFVKVMPKDDPANTLGEARVVLQPPDLIAVLTKPDDRESVEAYVIEWSEPREVHGELHEVRVRQLIALEARAEGDSAQGTWWVGTFNDGGKRDEETRWLVEVTPATWPHPWPPIIDWQNLPSDDGYYGLSDLEDLTGLNDGVNFTASNINKIIYFHGHPRTIGTGFSAGELQDTAVDAFWTIPNANAKVANLEMSGDLQSSYAFLTFLRESFWDIGRELDVSTLRDRIGQITNFGLKVLANAALSKLGEKRLTYGDGIQRINKALLALGGFPDAETELLWRDPLPANETEQVDRLAKEREMGVVSKETTAEELGLDWEAEQERMTSEESASGNIGEQLLRAFERGTQTGLNRQPSMDQNNPTARLQPGSMNGGTIQTQ